MHFHGLHNGSQIPESTCLIEKRASSLFFSTQNDIVQNFGNFIVSHEKSKFHSIQITSNRTVSRQIQQNYGLCRLFLSSFLFIIVHVVCSAVI